MKHAAIILGALGLALPAQAYVRETSNWNPSELPVHYAINLSTAPGVGTHRGTLGMSAAQTAVEGAFATWSAAGGCTSWLAHDDPATSLHANSGDGNNVIEWVNGSWPAELGDVSSVIGITTPEWTVGGYFIDADIRFNNVGFDWDTTGAGVDTQSIATHEEGHFLGLDHTPVRGAIMLAVYGGGLVRTLSSDDIAGVCAIYPGSSMPPPDAGTGPSTDPCAAHGTTCDGCTPFDGCGFCADTNSCVTGRSSGPVAGSCSDYVWLSRDCSATATGTGRFGDPCNGPGDCGSGGLCVGTSPTTAFCSRACADDCGCPDTYACLAIDSTLSVCVDPGTGTCAAPAPDAGQPLPPTDGGTVTPPPVDGGGTLFDGGVVAPGTDAGPGHHERGACACTAPGGSSSSPIAMIFGGMLGALVLTRRRR